MNLIIHKHEVNPLPYAIINKMGTRHQKEFFPLASYFTFVVLPQFSITGYDIDWGDEIRLDPDVFGYQFWIDGIEYLLIFEDYHGSASDPGFIENQTGLRPMDYEYIQPTSHTNIAPSYDGLVPDAPYRYIPGVTGRFTLLRIYTTEEAMSPQPKKNHQKLGDRSASVNIDVTSDI